jgi:hypothetical protein
MTHEEDLLSRMKARLDDDSPDTGTEVSELWTMDATARQFILQMGFEPISAVSSEPAEKPSLDHGWYTEYWAKDGEPTAGIFVMQAIQREFAGAVLFSEGEIVSLIATWNHMASHHAGHDHEGHSHD